MMIVTAGTLAVGATAGMWLEQRFGTRLTAWVRSRLTRWRRSPR